MSGTGPTFMCALCLGQRQRCVKCLEREMARIQGELAAARARTMPAMRGVTCNVCGRSDTEGFRYKCVCCDDYDLCQDCHAAGEHSEHALLEIKYEDQPVGRASAVMSRGRAPIHAGGLGRTLTSPVLLQTQQPPVQLMPERGTAHGQGFPSHLGAAGHLMREHNQQFGWVDDKSAIRGDPS